MYNELVNELHLLESNLLRCGFDITTLNPSTNKEYIRDIFIQISINNLPDELLLLYLWHDGLKSTPFDDLYLFPHFDFLSLKSVLSNYNDLRKIKSKSDLYSLQIKHHSSDILDGDDSFWNEKLIPIFHQFDGGTFLLYDCSTSITHGRIFNYWIGDTDIGNKDIYPHGAPIQYDNILCMFRSINLCLEKHAYIFDNNKWKKDSTQEALLSSSVNRYADFWGLGI